MLMAQSRLIQILLLTTAYMLGICSLLSGEMSTCAAVSMSFQCRPNPSKVIKLPAWCFIRTEGANKRFV